MLAAHTCKQTVTYLYNIGLYLSRSKSKVMLSAHDDTKKTPVFIALKLSNANMAMVTE
jgi:hypothetical protein